METKFTPGPWRVRDASHGGRLVFPAHDRREITPTDNNGLVAVLFKTNRAGSDEANAALISAAPDLYEALKLARECIAYCRRAHKDAQSGEGVPVEVFIDAALAKARGEQP